MDLFTLVFGGFTLLIAAGGLLAWLGGGES